MAWHRPSTVRVDLAANGPEPCQRIWKNRPLVKIIGKQGGDFSGMVFSKSLGPLFQKRAVLIRCSNVLLERVELFCFLCV